MIDCPCSMIATSPFSFGAGVVLSAFFYGYIVAQLPGGLLALKFGGKNLFGTGILCGAVITLLIPLVARIHVGFLIALQFGIGLFQVKLWVSFIAKKCEVKGYNPGQNLLRQYIKHVYST